MFDISIGDIEELERETANDVLGQKPPRQNPPGHKLPDKNPLDKKPPCQKHPRKNLPDKTFFSEIL